MGMEPLTFRYNFQKAENAAKYILEQTGNALAIPHLLTLAFLVDREYLIHRHRIIFGGKYGYTSYGPVPFELWGRLQYHNHYYVSHPAFQVKDGIVSSISPINNDYLAEAEIETLLAVVEKHKDLSMPDLISCVKQVTKGLKKRALARCSGGHAECFPIPVELFFVDLPDDQRKDVLECLRERQELQQAFSS